MYLVGYRLCWIQMEYYEATMARTERDGMDGMAV